MEEREYAGELGGNSLILLDVAAVIYPGPTGCLERWSRVGGMNPVSLRGDVLWQSIWVP